MFPFYITVQTQAMTNSDERSSTVKAGTTGACGGVGSEGEEQDQENDQDESSDEEEIDTDDTNISLYVSVFFHHLPVKNCCLCFSANFNLKYNFREMMAMTQVVMRQMRQGAMLMCYCTAACPPGGY